MKNSHIILCVFIIASTVKAFDDEPLTMIFAHGLADTHKQANLWREAHPYLHNGPIIAKDFPDATDRFWRVNFPWTSLGQDNEIAVLKETVDTFQRENPGKKIILVGLSRGAATVCNYLALYQPENIAASILISPYPSMRHIAQRIVTSSWLNDIPYMLEISPYLVGCIFWQYSDRGIHPIDVVTRIGKRIPLLFLSLEKDHLVPSALTQILVDKLIADGHTRVHHLTISEGRHGKPIPGEEGERMQRIIQAFLYCYGLPCDQAYAQKGLLEFLRS